jgi:tRNA(Arg) A34 adenosine deaminase TadA
MTLPEVHISLPDWADAVVAGCDPLTSDSARMRYVVELARRNVELGTGGPFAAAVFESDSGRLVAAGLNLVVPLRSSVLHAEVVAILLAQRRLGAWSLAAAGLPRHELVSSCEPCAMCLGATLWSGARRLVCGATRDDAQRIGFDEGPVFPESYAYLEARGIEVSTGIEREAARAVLDRYAERSGVIYNG